MWVFALVCYALGLGLGGLVDYALSLLLEDGCYSVKVGSELANVSWWEAHPSRAPRGLAMIPLRGCYEAGNRPLSAPVGLLIVYPARR